jgi:hypothetical protein
MGAGETFFFTRATAFFAGVDLGATLALDLLLVAGLTAVLVTTAFTAFFAGAFAVVFFAGLVFDFGFI